MVTLRLNDGSRSIAMPGKSVRSKKAAQYVASLFETGGYLPDDSDERITWREMADTILERSPGVVEDEVGTHSITPLLATATEVVIREPIEPVLVVTSLFRPIRAQGLRTEMIVGAMGAVTAGDYGERGQVPEVNFTIGGDTSVVTIGKSGIAAAFTEEALRYSTWELMAINMRLMGNALARLKEQKSIVMLKRLGTPMFDNAQPANSLFGVTTGRDYNMAANGSLTVGDIIKVMAHMTEQGFMPDTLVMHPRFFWMWFEDPVLRAVMLAGGQGGSFFNPWQGNPGGMTPWSNLGGRGPSNGQSLTPFATTGGGTVSSIAELSNQANSAPSMPSYMPFGMRMLISPLMPFDTESDLGDIFIVSSNDVGLLFIDEEQTATEWRDEDTEVVKLKLKERYAHGVLHEAQAVGVLKNIRAREFNRFDETIRVTHTSGVSNINPSTPVV